MKKLNSHLERRTELIADLEKFLIGPIEEHEVLSSKKTPMALYLTGKLVPFGSTVEVVNEEEYDVQTNELLDTENVDELIANRNPFRASSMGFSFRMSQLVPINIKISWGMYGKNHVRKPIMVTLDNLIPENKEWQLEEPGVLRCKVKERDGIYHVSFYLLNGYKRDSYPLQNEIMFQTKLAVEVKDESIAKFSSRADQWNLEDELLYRHVNEYAIGHGVGIGYSFSERKCLLETTWLPTAEVPIVEHREIKELTTSMVKLAEMSAEELQTNLYKLVYSYRVWVKEQADKFEGIPSHLHSVVNNNISKVNRIIERIENGILSVVSSDKKLKAFRFMNRVIAIQQAQSKVALKYRSNSERVAPIYNGKWRLFQLAFILMNIDGVSNPEHKDRDLVDLLWFPTGGGKTEAYLGVAAFLMGLRRLNGIAHQRETYAGVTVLMRYTLRLLTTQQFQRATAMVCAAEFLRQKDPVLWGLEPFSIGLWIGQASTPNKIEEAKEKLQQIIDGNEVTEANPVQLENCPWCGSSLSAHNYHFEDHRQRITCSHSECYYASNGGIPAYTVDEVIYNHVPTILIGTVDKIAQIAWNKRFCELFGWKTHYSPIEGFVNDIDYKGYHLINKQRIYTEEIDGLIPPELIIQDELHLISGPLGSLTGLYELAIDYLCQYNGKGPKIIASTATIRGAQEQVKRLYGREVSQFPLSVTDARDNYFSYQIPIEEKPGRFYLGVCAPGVSGAIHTVHVYAALLSMVRNLEEKDDSIDPYWTVLGYFNTVKELSGTSTKLKDEIPIRLKLLSDRSKTISPLITEELTSRKKAAEIPQVLGAIERKYDENGLDVVLATNMISVGVDVNRLGLMVMHSQPKTASEYIQATSRVGRSYPGLVVTLFNSMRSRDLSHFERFNAFHQAMYRYVEPTSVTSFASGSLERGLTGLVVGMIRQTDYTLRKETGAVEFRQNSVTDEILEFIIKRAVSTSEVELNDIKKEIEKIYSWWEDRAISEEKLSYRQNVKQGRTRHILKNFKERTNYQYAKPTLNSLRNVEGEIKIVEMRNYE
ncbi:TPA: DISARM system helicase DrmA [Bacillus cereus]|uniref:DISARM system helicase DrmA n=1 Tax=Bacillus cereus TaxID=1396 RepID=UPI0019294B58|nr:DISARM system helicase DrmA [Bacillus cereus]MBL3763927.1 helicase [Bacillus cereus]MBL3770907.1 helicase [Bacillus cereus]MBL3775612.1 helicase [Bacillus cereus]MBL3787014.1 helicase [Bacillus cereus]